MVSWQYWGRYLDSAVSSAVYRWRKSCSFGERGEAAAARYLKRRGFQIVGRRERDRLGELDLVAVENRTVVFVEVKTRRRGSPAEAVHGEKQRRLTRAALGYLKRHNLLECRARFDVVTVVWPENTLRPTIRHIRHAFDAHGKWQMHR